MKAVDKIKERIARNRYGKAFLEQYGFKTTVLAFVSLIISFAFAVMNGVFGILESSLWYGALAGYYILLIIFRSSVIIADARCRRKYLQETAKYVSAQNVIRLASGAFLVIVEIAMAAAVTQMVLADRPVKSGEIMAISTAAYAFYKFTMAVINLVKAKRHGDPVAQSLRILNFADACMSMASLTVLMLATFGEGEGQDTSSFELITKACVGFAACAVVLAAAAVMIAVSAKKLRSEKRDAGQRTE